MPRSRAPRRDRSRRHDIARVVVCRWRHDGGKKRVLPSPHHREAGCCPRGGGAIAAMFIDALPASCMVGRADRTITKENHPMKKTPILTLALGMLLTAAASAAPQTHDDHTGQQAGEHQGQQASKPSGTKSVQKKGASKAAPSHKKGERLASGNRGDSVDYRAHKLSAPPKGHEWRKVGNDYVLIAVATGVISSVIAASN
jgi:Ni/Co efflux regulator RcnB